MGLVLPGALRDRIMFNSILQATVMEVKVIEGHGTTLDILLVNGELRAGDTVRALRGV